MTDFEKYSLIIVGISAVASFLVVTVAIWGERIRQFWVKPKLQMKLDDPIGILNKTSDGKKGRYYLLRVSNNRKSSPAKNVRVLLTRVFKRGPDDTWIEKVFSGSTQVTWRWPLQMPLYLTIGPDELSTFGFLMEDSDKFSLQLYSIPNNLNHLISPNDPTRFEFKAVSDTAESNTLVVEVAWDGKWVEGGKEMQNHLIVKEIRS